MENHHQHEQTKDENQTEEMNHHGAHGGHAGHHDHHAHMVEDFKKRFWISLIVAIPIAILAPMLQNLFGFEVSFPGSDVVLFSFIEENHF